MIILMKTESLVDYFLRRRQSLQGLEPELNEEIQGEEEKDFVHPSSLPPKVVKNQNRPKGIPC